MLLTTTFDESAVNWLPHDPAVLDSPTEPYSADESISKEKEDDDAFTG